MNAKEQRLIIFAHPRCGSTSLWRALNIHPLIHLLLEPFHEHREEWGKGVKNYKHMVHTAGDLRRVIDELYQISTGFKTLFFQLNQEQNEYTLKEADKVILLHRMNFLKTAVSTHIALQTNLWAIIENRTQAKNQEVIRKSIQKQPIKPIDVDALRQMIQDQKQAITHYRNYLAGIHKPFVEMTYEELYAADRAERKRKITDIFKFLELFLPTSRNMENIEFLLSPQRKINDVETYICVPNIYEVEKRLGSKENGFLFS